MGDEPSPFGEWGTAVGPTAGDPVVRREGRPRRTVFVGLALVLCVAVGALLAVSLGGQSAPAVAATADTPMQLLHTAFRDAAARGSVRESESVSTAKSAITFSDDVGRGEGTQDIYIAGEGETKVVVLDGTAYFVGESQAVLIHYFGFSASLASQLRGRWIGVPHSNRAYATVASDATFSSAIAGARAPSERPSHRDRYEPPRRHDGDRHSRSTASWEQNGVGDGYLLCHRFDKPAPDRNRSHEPQQRQRPQGLAPPGQLDRPTPPPNPTPIASLTG